MMRGVEWDELQGPLQPILSWDTWEVRPGKVANPKSLGIVRAPHSSGRHSASSQEPTQLNILHILLDGSSNVSWFLSLVVLLLLSQDFAFVHPGVNRLLLLPEVPPAVQVGDAIQNQVLDFDPLPCAALHQVWK